MEEWLEIEEFPNYLVSTEGRILSVRRNLILKQQENRGGYLYVNLYNRYGMASKTVHRLVANASLPFRSHRDQVNHIDGDKWNNALRNLEWVTSRENHRHAFRTGLRNSKNAPKSVMCVETGETFSSMAEAASALDVHAGNIAGVIKGRARHTKGYSFVLVERGGDLWRA